MNKVVLSFIVGVAALSLATASFAQGGPPGRGGPGGMGGPGGGFMQRMLQRRAEMIGKLGLSPSQKKKVDALFKKSDEKRMAMMKAAMPAGGGRPNFMAMRPKMEALNKERDAGMKAILTKAQFDKYTALQKEAMARRGRGGMGGPPGGMGGPGRPGGGRPGG